MDFNYKKNDNQKLFAKLQANNLLNINNCQNYNPLYEKYFELNEKNYNNITLNNIFKNLMFFRKYFIKIKKIYN